jgi:hypothetical protein
MVMVVIGGAQSNHWIAQMVYVSLVQFHFFILIVNWIATKHYVNVTNLQGDDKKILYVMMIIYTAVILWLITKQY